MEKSPRSNHGTRQRRTPRRRPARKNSNRAARPICRPTEFTPPAGSFRLWIKTPTLVWTCNRKKFFPNQDGRQGPSAGLCTGCRRADRLWKNT